MQNWEVAFAKHFKDRDNPDVNEAVIGTIISTNPISVSIYSGRIILNSNQCYVSESLKSITGTINLENVADHGALTTKFTITRELNIGDEVLCIPAARGQKYFIVDKVATT